MKKLLCTIFALGMSCQSYAGLIISADKAEYNVGDTIALDFQYQTPNAESVEDILDPEFDVSLYFDYASDVALFMGASLPSAYDNSDPLPVVDKLSVGSIEYFLSTFGPDAPFGSDTLFSIGTLEFVARAIGTFDINVNDFAITDIADFEDFTFQSSFSANVVAVAEVSSPSTLAMFAVMASGLLGFRRFKA